MPVSQYREDFSSLIPALHLLMNLGYNYLSPEKANELRNNRLQQPVLDEVLRKQLPTFNSFTFKDETHSFSDANLEKAIQEVWDIPFDSLITTNEDVYDLITLGKSFEQTIQGYTRSFSLHYVDWEKPENNMFHVCDEFVVERRHSHQTRRPDIVLFVNGIPFVVVECKRPDIPDAATQAVSQHLRNQRVEEIPHLFVYSQILLSLSQNDALYGTVNTDSKFWSRWKEEYSSTDKNHLQDLVNKPLSEQQIKHLFGHRDQWEQNLMSSLWESGKRIPSYQDKTIYSLLRPERLLEITQRFIVFDNKVKKVPRYQQYFAVKETIERVTQVRGDEPRKGGVIWHTTGSGKSITMVLLAKAIALEPSIVDPKVILVTDRVDLDDQIYGTFKNCGKEVKQATSGENLFRLIEENKAPIITTIIDKFESGLNKKKLKSNSRDIFVLVDESHRSQYGVSHASMKRVFPNACYIGFTGTPLLRDEKSTARKFGGFIHSYSMNQAVQDKAVVPLIYEGRISELHGNQEQIDRWFERITEDLTEEQRADLKRKFRQEEELARSEERLKEITYDIIHHYKTTYRDTGLKGQFAVASRQDAIKYKRYFDELGDISTEVVMSHPDTRQDNTSVDESTIPEVQRFWKAMLDKYGSPDKYQDSIIKSFKYSDEPEIIIVIDKLLTGFDAPKNAVLYLDKRLKDHNILQAIARVNRLHDGKSYGLIIDYRGIFGKLNDAIELYKALEREGFDHEDVVGTVTNVLDEIKRLPQYHTDVWEVFKGVENKNDTESMQLHLEPENTRHMFYERLRTFADTLKLALSNAKFQEEADTKTKQKYKDDLKMFLSLRNTVKQRYGESVDYSSYEAQIRNMVEKYIGAEEVREIVKPVDLFSIEAFERELEGIEGDAAKADTIASRVKKTLTENMEEDPILYKRLSEVINEAIAEHRAKRLSDADYLQRMRDSLDELRTSGASELPERIKEHSEAKAYYRVILEELVDEDIDGLKELSADAAIKLDEILNSLKKRDWSRDLDTINKMKTEIEDYLYSLKGRHDLNWDWDTIDRIVEKNMEIAIKRDS